MKKLFNWKFIVFLIFIFVFSVIFMSNLLGMTKDFEEQFTEEEFRYQLNEEMEKDPEFLDKFFHIPNDTELTDEKVEELMEISRHKSYIAVVGLSFVISLFFTIIIFVPIVLFVLPLVSGGSLLRKYKLNDDDFKKSKTYYRDILKDFNPSELSFIDDFKIDENALVADLLMLEQKKIITYEDGVFRLVEGAKTDNLNDIEKFILNEIDEKGTNLIKLNRFNYMEVIKKTCYKDKLLEDKKFPWARFIFKVLLSVVGYILIYWLVFKSDIIEKIVTTNIFLQIILLFGLVFGFMFVFFAPMYMFYKYMVLFIRIAATSFGRTDNGEEVNRKLEGLKIFIRDFSILDGRQKKELVLWNEYLIYSVMFNINKKIISEYRNSIKI